MVLSPRKSGEFIVKNADYVKINDVGIDKLKTEIITAVKNETLNVKNFSQVQYHPNANDKNAPNWLFVIDSLNFCFWTPGDSIKWQIDGNTGYFALCAAISRARKEGIDIINPNFYKDINEEQILHIFRSDDGTTTIPLVHERVKCLQEVGFKLVDKFDGSFENCIKLANGSAKKLLNIIVTEFPCYRDEATFKGEIVSFYKRAQILIGDVWACYQGQGLGKFDDINEEITMFADYRVPQVLVHFDALEYNDELLNTLKSNKILESGCNMEIEIRGASIYIVEEVKKRIKKEHHGNSNDPVSQINSILIDHFLWDYRRKFAEQLDYIPFHKVLNIYY